MNKTKLIQHIADKAEIPIAAATRAFDAVVEGITCSLKDYVPVHILGLGTFTVKIRAPRTGRNPSTGEKIQIKEAKVIGFKPGKALKEAVKKESE